MGVLKKGESVYPFWGASMNLITGLDPLGLQTTSEATYATMLPGVTNLTNRMRYYGFYCWLLDFYFAKETKGNSKEQYRFIRRAELMIALLMQTEKKDIQQITGSNFASNLISTESLSYFNLAAGADKEDSDKAVYWKYTSGAFGQYYYGAMRAISLVVSAENDKGDVIYNVSQPHPRQSVSGKQLADAFDATLTAEIKELFYRNIKEGKLSKTDVPALIEYFAIDTIDPDSDEWKLYALMLLDKDDPSEELEELVTFHRKETILSLLSIASSNENKYTWQDFLLAAYKHKINTYSETNIGWYCYQLNEYWQYSCGTLLWSVLQELYSNQKEMYLPTFVNDLANRITTGLLSKIGHSGAVDLKTVVSKLPIALEEETLYNEIESASDEDQIEVAVNGFLLLFTIYRNNIDTLPQLREFITKKHTIRDGNMTDGLASVRESENESLNKFIEQFILRKVIYRHQMVAIRKMGNGSQATHKFIIEEQYIRYIDNFPPRKTSPRMYALQNLLFDLKIIDSDAVLTPLSERILEK